MFVNSLTFFKKCPEDFPEGFFLVFTVVVPCNFGGYIEGYSQASGVFLNYPFERMPFNCRSKLCILFRLENIGYLSLFVGRLFLFVEFSLFCLFGSFLRDGFLNIFLVLFCSDGFCGLIWIFLYFW